MKPVDFLLLGIILALLVAAGWFIIRSKKQGKKCVGCPHGGQCSGHCGGK